MRPSTRGGKPSSSTTTGSAAVTPNAGIPVRRDGPGTGVRQRAPPVNRNG
jgi:hypothetical protein